MSAKPRSQPPAPLLWLAVYFPQLPLDVFAPEIAAQKAVAQTALAQNVIHTLTPEPATVILEENRVGLANAAAQAEGLVLGCSLATAHSISPDITYFTRDKGRELHRLGALAQCLYRFSSMVSLEAPDCILIEIQGSLRLWQGKERLVMEAIQLCEEMGHQCIARLAHTPQAAVALARANATQLPSVPLHSIGLSHHDIKERVIEHLANMGIYTLGQLIALPKASLGKRFGQSLVRYLRRLEGDLVEPRNGIQPSNNFAQQLHLLKPIMNKTVLLQGPMPYLALQLQHWLIARQLACVSLEWQFAPFRGNGISVEVGFAGGKQHQGDFMRLSHLQLENIKLPGEVLSIGLKAKVIAPLQAINSDLFGSTESASGLVSELVDELTARLGPGTCRSIQPVHQYTPEKAWQQHSSQPQLHSQPRPQLQQVQSRRKKSGVHKTQQHLTANPQLMGKRPLWLFSPPRQITFAELELLQGPERIQSNFHLEPKQSAIFRDYYIAKHKHGALCWAFTESPNKTPTASNSGKTAASQWYLHGYFA
jgi:protein ImuB